MAVAATPATCPRSAVIVGSSARHALHSILLSCAPTSPPFKQRHGAAAGMPRPSDPKRGHGDLSGKLELFLLSTLQERTTSRYLAALAAFRTELEARDVEWVKLDEEARDICLAEFVLEWHDNGQPRGVATDLVACLHKLMPRHRYRIASATLAAWSAEAPPRQAPAAPASFARAAAVLAVSMGQPAVGTALWLCFAGVLRISEPLALRMRDVVESPEGLILLLGRTKRGMLQRVLIRDRFTINWVRLYLDTLGKVKPHDWFLPVSYTRVARWLERMCTALQLAPKLFTTHSFRRGGATQMLLDGFSVETIMEYGRWQFSSSVRLYLQRGEPFLLRLKAGQVPGAWRLIDNIATIGCAVWDAHQLNIMRDFLKVG